MAENKSIKAKATSLLDNVRYYWKEPPKGRYMNFKEILSYAFGGIGFYSIVCMSYTCLLGTTNVFITGTLGIQPVDMYVMYVIGVLSGIPLTALRANIIDNTRNKAGKYRPYILRMGIPTILLFVGMVWFPYDSFGSLFGDGMLFGKTASYIAKCAVLLLFNILLQFFYYFFYDSYENLIHVLSPNSQERADVASIKAVIYSLGPSIVNIIMPLVAQNVFNTNQTDVRVYRLVYPILSVFGILLCTIVYANTQEKIIQAKTHVIQIKFIDSLKAVAKNKYFWIISMASWIGFLEIAYSNILYWLCNYGGSCSNNVYSIIVTLYGNSQLWGMIMAPFFIRKFGKKIVQIVTNLFNIAFILMMLPFVALGTNSAGNIKAVVIWGVLACLYANGIVAAFAHILNPSIQADIRDYQQYKTGERIDGMFSAVTAIGNVISLATSAVLPALYEKYGMTVENAQRVVSDDSLMSRILPGAKETIGQMLAEQTANGQDLYNASNALYDVEGTLLPMLKILIVVAAVGATLNVIPFFFYDFTEKKQKGVIRVLKIRALFEDYENNALNDHDLVEAIDLVNKSREMAVSDVKVVSKNDYKSIKDKAARKEAKKAYRDALVFNEEIKISQFVCQELDKFKEGNVVRQVELYKKVYNEGLDGIKNMNINAVKDELSKAKALPKGSKDEKELRKIETEIAKDKLSSYKNYQKYYGSVKEFVEPDMAKLEENFKLEDDLTEEMSNLTKELAIAKKAGNNDEIARIKAQIKKDETDIKECRKVSKYQMDELAIFNRAAQCYISARKLLQQEENFSHFDEIAVQYDEAKARAEAADIKKAEDDRKRQEELDAELARRKAEKAAKKAAKKNK